MAVYRELHDGWTVAAVGDTDAVPDEVRAAGDIPTVVPGCVHTDLLTGGLIPDPFLDDNEHRVAWIGRTDWRYRRALSPADWAGTDPAGAGPERIDLVCQGLDTVARIEVDGVLVGETANQHRSYRFDLRPALAGRATGPAGSAELAVTFTSAYTYAEGLRAAIGPLPGAYAEPYQFIRKMACNFGWDWGPTLVTAGIWRPIGLHAWSTARLATVRPLATVDPDGTGRVAVHVELERSGVGPAVPLVVSARIGDTVATAKVDHDEASALIEVLVPDAALWWPTGYGEAVLHDLSVELSTVDSALDEWTSRIGFRTVELDTTPDDIGAAFTIRINGQPILVKGANWIPDDSFPTRVDRARYARRIGQARAANLNLLRIWGGGLYESEDFYSLCDEMGLLVWQDFLFACAAYPEEQPIAAEVEAEARENVVRLAPHPSLILWNGNNENVEGWWSWGWQSSLEGRTWGLGYYLETLPAIVAELDPTRPYWPSSPYSGSMDRNPLDDGYGTKHIWDVWNRADYTVYREYVPRLAAEFGYQAPPNFATLRRSVSDRPLAPDSPGVLHHQKADEGNDKLARGLAYHFPAPVDFDDWHYLTQVNQARALTLGIEHLRASWPICSGAIVWQLNDCWPVTSWAAVDGDERLKPLWYALRRVYAERLLTVQPRSDGLVVAVANDTPDDWATEVTLSRRTFAGEVLASVTVPVTADARSVALLAVPADLSTPADGTGELLVATADTGRALWFFAEDTDLAYPAAGFQSDVRVEGSTVLLTITAETLLRDLVVQADRLDPGAVVSDAAITLLPGETVTLRIDTTRAVDPEALVRLPVLHTVNDAVRRARS